MRKGLHYTLGYTLEITRSNLRKFMAVFSFLILIPYTSQSLAETPLISSGWSHSITVLSDGRVMAWGYNSRGQVGDGTSNPRNTLPMVVVDNNSNPITGIQAIDGGTDHTLALKTDGSLLAWGSNGIGQLSDGSNEDQYNPVTVVDGSSNPITGIQAIAVNGTTHNYALKTDGSLLHWGSGSIPNPVVVVDSNNNPITGIQAITSGYPMALKTDGSLLHWGRIRFLNGTTTSGNYLVVVDSNTPVALTDSNNIPITDIQAIATGDYFALALRTDGTLLAWGENRDGRLGDGTLIRRLNPVYVRDSSGNAISDIKAIAAGAEFSLALKNDGTLLAWGNNDYGQLGDGTTTSRINPVVVVDNNGDPIAGIQAISAGKRGHSLALRADGALLTWGDNSYGQLGDGTTANSSHPVVIFSSASQDFNGDGQSDVLWRNDINQLSQLYYMDGSTILEASDNLNSVVTNDLSFVGFGDFNNDNKADILSRVFSTGQNTITLMGEETSTQVLLTIPALVSPVWSVAGVDDFDGDGHVDIFWHHDDGENRITFMNGTTEVSTVSVNTIVDPEWTVSGIADFNNDGKADVLWRNSVNRRVWLYLMDGSTIINGAGEGEHVAYTSANWDIEGVGDFSGDGKGDILWRHNTNGRVWMYLMNGPAVANGSSSAPGEHVDYTSLNWDIVAIGDYDGDGKQDIFWRNSLTGQNHMYRMNGAALKQDGGTAVNTLSDLNWAVNN